MIQVPLDASIVTLAVGNNEPSWQRPIGGWSLFPATVETTTRYRVEVYDAAGDMIEVVER